MLLQRLPDFLHINLENMVACCQLIGEQADIPNIRTRVVLIWHEDLWRNPVWRAKLGEPLHVLLVGELSREAEVR